MYLRKILDEVNIPKNVNMVSLNYLTIYPISKLDNSTHIYKSLIIKL